jgi:UDP-glucose 4-epimerase
VNLAGARILVTGAAGFVGSHLVERLCAEGATVRAFCRYNSRGAAGWLDDLRPAEWPGLEIVAGDIRDARSVDAAVAGTDVVLHLAALIAIPYSYEAPASYIETNIVGTFNVLEAVRRHGARLVHTSTSEVYGTPDVLPITELHPLRAQSPYSATKIAADKLCEAWSCSYDVPVTVVRPFNTYGPRQSARAVIPTILGQLLAGSTELRIGSVHPRRDFTFVSDTVDGFVKAACTPQAAGRLVQLGAGSSVTVKELIALAADVLDLAEPRVVVEEPRVRPRGSEVDALEADVSLAAEQLGWRPTISLRQGLEWTAEWLRHRTDAAAAARYVR